MENQLHQKKEDSSRKKFIVWTVGILGSLSVLKFMKRKPVEPTTNTIKMLAQDGTLVEVDASNLLYCGRKKKASDDDVKTWVTKK